MDPASLHPASLRDADIPGRMDESVESKTPNSILVRCAYYIRGERSLDYIGHLHDVFNQEKFILKGVEVSLRLIRRKIRFVLWITGQISVQNSYIKCELACDKNENKRRIIVSTCYNVEF